MRFSSSVWLLAGLSCAGAVQAREIVREVRISNPTGQERKAYPVVVDLHRHADGLDIRSAKVVCDGREIASQADDLDGDFRADELAFTVDVPARGEAVCSVTLSDTDAPRDYPRGTRAYLKLNDKSGKHPEVKSVTFPDKSDMKLMYNSIYGHGAVFESELAAFRVYMDNRQSIDLYGKTHYRLEMDSTGFYTTHGQLAQGYGCDILWAGQSVGAGSFRGVQDGKPCYIDTVDWRRQTILADGPVRTVVEVADGGWIYHGQTLHMTQHYTLYAGHRDVEVDIRIDGASPDATFCTGIQKLESQSTGFMQDDGLCGSWGDNVPEKGEPDHDEWVGLGLYADKAYRKGMKEDEFNYLTLLGTDAGKHIRYHLTVCARREEYGFKDSGAWFDYLRLWKTGLDTPCIVDVR